MFIVKIGEDQVRVVGKEDAKTLAIKLIDMGCTERVSTKLVADGEEGEDDNDRD